MTSGQNLELPGFQFENHSSRHPLLFTRGRPELLH